MVRLIDIAKKTGFSVAVVSRALRQEKDPYDRISEKSRNLIRKTAQEMGYSRNLQAAFLRRGQMPAVRVLMPAWASPEIIQMTMGISDASLQLGYPLIFHYYSRETDYISFLEQSCHEKNTGVIFYLQERMNREKLQRGCETYLASGGKMIFMNIWSADFSGIVPDMVMLNIDEEHGGRLAAGYLKGLSCKDYAIVYTSPDHYSLLRRKGFMDALVDEGKRGYSFDFLRVGENYPQYEKRSRKLLDEFYEKSVKQSEKPYGLFFTSSFMANAVMNDLIWRGLDARKQLHAVGYSSNTVDQYPFYYYAKIVIPFYEMGNAAMRKLVNIFNGKQEKSQVFQPFTDYDYEI